MGTEVACLQCGKPFDASMVSNRFAGVCPSCLAKFAASGETDVEQSPGIADPSMKPPLKLGGTFHGLEIVELLGAGGMGVVYKARQTRLDRMVALKVLSPQLSKDAEFISRFNREAKAMAALSHAGIVQVYDFGQEADLCFLVMEYVDGLSLRQLMKDRKLAPEEALKIVPRICEALEYAHSKGVIHRDIKPENILLDKEGRVKIADFGLAKVLAREGASRFTVSNVVMGTPGYMAPEQYQSMSVDHRADIYSLGAVFYEMLTGQIPVGRFDIPSKRVQIDVRLDDVVMKALENEPDRRYQRASEFQTSVETVSVSAKAPATPSEHDEKDPAKKAPEVVWLSLIFAGISYLILYTAFGSKRHPGLEGVVDSLPKFFLFQGGAAFCAIIALIQLRHHPLRREKQPYAIAAIFILFPPLGIIGGFVALHVMSKLDGQAPPVMPRRSPPPAEIPAPAPPHVLVHEAGSSSAKPELMGASGWHPGRQVARWLLLVPLMIVIIGLLILGALMMGRGAGLEILLIIGLLLPLLLGFRRIQVLSAAWAGMPVAPGSRVPDGPRLHGLAIAAFVVAMSAIGCVVTLAMLPDYSGGIGCALILVVLVLMVVAFGMSIGALSVIRSSNGKWRGRGLAWAALITVLLMGLASPVILLAGRSSHDSGFIFGGPRPSETATMFGAFSKMVGSGAPHEWFDGGSSETQGSGMRSGTAVKANDAKSMQEWVSKVGFRDTAARHIATMTIRHDRMKGSEAQIVTWFAEVETGIDPGKVMGMKRTMPGEISMSSGRLLMGVFSHKHPEGEELVQRLAKYYSNEIARIERARDSD